MTINRTRSSARQVLERFAGGPLTLGMALAATREGEGMSQVAFAARLGITRSHLCDIEKGRKPVSPVRAAEMARVLGCSEKQYVRLALQDQLTRGGLAFEVELHTRPRSRRRAA